MKNQDTLNAYIKQALVENWDSAALSNFRGETFLYRDIARKIAKIRLIFEAAELKPGDKIALCGKNSAQWAISFLATVSYGAVVVPILSDFKADTLQHLVSHSDARILLVDESIWKQLNDANMPEVKAAICIENYEILMSRSEKITYTRQHLNELFGQRYPNRFKPSDLTFAEVKPDDIVLINYTAGSTGFSKGVMLTERSIWSNVQFSIDGLKFLKPGDNMLSLLPLAHMFGLLVEILHPLVKGCHIVLLNRTPAPKILLDAFSVVKPKLIVAVPLVLEKIIKTRVFPQLNKPMIRLMLHIPGLRNKIYSKVYKSLIDAFGGNLLEMIVGGAGLAKDVEEFLRKIKFPVTVGYGMTECGPLISYSPWDIQRPGSCGRVVDRMEVRVDSDDPINKPGVLWVRGDNVMAGYYKNNEATHEVMHDGWMNTGDICQIDNEGFIYIRGRDKNMILGPSGQNIYPEEIEAKLNDNPAVAESVVIDDNGQLIALIHPDYDVLKATGIEAQDEDAVLKAVKNAVTLANQNLPAYSHISDVRIHKDEFEKTPKRSIKRYLYQPKQSI